MTELIKPPNFFRGDDLKYTVNLTAKDSEGNETPISIHGGLLFVTFKSDPSMIDDDAEIKAQQAGIEADPSNPTGQIIISIPKEDTEVEPGYYYYDFQYISPDGSVKTILPDVDTSVKDSQVYVREDITRRVA